MSATQLQGRLILCVDDEPRALLVRKAILEQHGYQVITAPDANVALELFRTHSVHLVITDHVLPGESGTELVAELKAINRAVPVAILTGYVEPPEGAELADAFITKGMGVQDFIGAVARLLQFYPVAASYLRSF